MPRGVVQEVEAVEEKPVAGVLMGLNGVAYLFLATALAAGVAWIVFVAKARDHDMLGDSDTTPTDKGNSNIRTADICFQAVVVSVLLYFVARHHFSHLHY
jgi:hypothetical protein